MGDYRTHPPEVIAQHIFDNSQLHSLVTGASITNPVQGSWDSDKPDHIHPATAELPAPPLPPSIAPVVQAVAESSRCSLATALAGVLGGINLCVAEEYDVQALARLPVPTSLFIVVSSESGWRKSEALGCGFSAHDAADNAIEAAWKAAKKAADTDADTAKKAADRSPVALRDNSTIPALLRALAWGRRTQGLKMTEASTLFAGHSFTHGRVDSMGELTKLWDGVPSSVLRVRDDNLEFRLSGQRLTMCTVGQPRRCGQGGFLRRRGQRLWPQAVVLRRHGAPQATAI